MAKRSKSGSNLAPFLTKCYEMVDDDSTDKVISWSQSNDSFVIWDMTQFTRDLLPKYFKHDKLSSFIRQLNIYGFRKVDTESWEFANEGFVKDQKHLLKSIRRRKHPQGSSGQRNCQPDQQTGVSDKVDYTSLAKEVEMLKTDESALKQELSKLRERQTSSQDKLLVLRESLLGMENNQQQLLSFLVMVMQSPDLLVQLLQPKESNWRMVEAGKIFLDQATECDNAFIPDGSIVRYQPPLGDDPSTNLTPPSVSDKTVEYDLSFDKVKDFFLNFDIPSFPSNEGFLPSENCGSIVMPELDIDKLEKFLLSSPGREDTEAEAPLDGEDTLASLLETEPMLDAAQLQNCELHSSVIHTEGIDQSPSLELLTEKLGSLSPGRIVE